MGVHSSCPPLLIWRLERSWLCVQRHCQANGSVSCMTHPCHAVGETRQGNWKHGKQCGPTKFGLLAKLGLEDHGNSGHTALHLNSAESKEVLCQLQMLPAEAQALSLFGLVKWSLFFLAVPCQRFLVVAQEELEWFRQAEELAVDSQTNRTLPRLANPM
eukprot:6462705-Amphidinium_carterae.1